MADMQWQEQDLSDRPGDISHIQQEWQLLRYSQAIGALRLARCWSGADKVEEWRWSWHSCGHKLWPELSMLFDRGLSLEQAQAAVFEMFEGLATGATAIAGLMRRGIDHRGIAPV